MQLRAVAILLVNGVVPKVFQVCITALSCKSACALRLLALSFSLKQLLLETGPLLKHKQVGGLMRFLLKLTLWAAATNEVRHTFEPETPPENTSVGPEDWHLYFCESRRKLRVLG